MLLFDQAWGKEPLLLHHNLTITVQPQHHSLTAKDVITFQRSSILPSVIELILNKNLVIDEIHINDSNVSIEQDTEAEHLLRIPLPSPVEADSALSITVRYHGMIADQPKKNPDLRFIKPDKTTGYIGSEGVYLTSETQWYPTMANTLATFQVNSTVPNGWETVTQGKEVSRTASQNHTTSNWNIPNPSEALTLAANHFVKQTREWNGITLATYLFPEDAALAEQYLDATATYLEMYTTLLGPYPFSKFAVVENFFPAGIGIPSYTLLGSRIIKRGYTQPYSLGHEIVHSWFGNSVFNKFARGNWVEGLTTYLSNYYYEELHASSETARRKRQHMVYEYNLYAPPSNEYPVRHFHHKETRIDNAIGYQKTAMVFHMLRQEVGETQFFTGIRRLVKEWTGKYADWNSIEQLFSKISGKDLSWFFQQWVEQAGSPAITIEQTEIQEDTHYPDQFLVDITLLQASPPYRLQLPVVLHLGNGKTHKTIIRMKAKEQTVRLVSPSQPTRLVIDPEFMILRRFARGEIPPMLNTWVTDSSQSVQLDASLTEKERKAYQPVLNRLHAQGTETTPEADFHDSLPEQSLLIFGHPLKSRLAQQGLARCQRCSGDR